MIFNKIAIEKITVQLNGALSRAREKVGGDEEKLVSDILGNPKIGINYADLALKIIGLYGQLASGLLPYIDEEGVMLSIFEEADIRKTFDPLEVAMIIYREDLSSLSHLICGVFFFVIQLLAQRDALTHVTEKGDNAYKKGPDEAVDKVSDELVELLASSSGINDL